MSKDPGVVLLFGLLLGSILTGLVLHVVRDIRARSRRRLEQYHEAQKRECEERELQRKRDHQLNHGRNVCNWLQKQLEPYASAGIEVSKIEQNGRMFSIFIRRNYAGMLLHVVQISYDFLELQEPYLGHIHYAKYGPDILFWVGDHSPYFGLDALVLRAVKEGVEAHPQLEDVQAKPLIAN